MTGLRNLLLTVLVLSGVAITGYYFHRVGVERKLGRSYSIARAPGDLLDELTSVFSSDPAPRRTPKPGPGGGPATGTGPAEPDQPAAPGGRDPADLLADARRHYLAGHYDRALPLLLQAADGGMASEMLQRSRLFKVLLGGDLPGSALDGPPQAYITLAGGEPFIAELVAQSDEDVTFRREDGIGARVKLGELKDHRIARTRPEKQALGEAEYKRRHARLRGSEAFLDLARFCHSYDLPSHLTYLLERGLDEPGDAIARAVFASWEEGRDLKDAFRADQAVTLLKHFFRTSEYARHAHGLSQPPAVARPPVRPSAEPPDPAPAGGGVKPPSGIGSVELRTPRISDPELTGVLAKAEALRKKANDHYLQAQPGAPDRARNRDIALKAYEEAIALYEEVEERWESVKLDRIFKELMERRYQLLKDKPVR